MVQTAIEIFQNKTGYKLDEYLLRVNDFFQSDFQRIYDWYSGLSKKPNVNSFKNMYTLICDSGVVLNLFYQNRNEFSKTYFWDLLEQLENINIKLITTSNLSKLLRSTRTKSSYSGKLSTDYTTRKYDTLEDVQRNVNNSPNYDDDWWRLAVGNDLKEEDYDNGGGLLLQVETNFNPGVNLQSVVDNPIGEKMYGRDMNRKITILDEDIEVLGYNETVLQSLDIFLETKLGTVPENKEIGYDESLVVGSSRGAVNFNILQRQLINIFNTDDSFTNFQITNISFKDDSVYLEFKINTIRGEILNKTLTI